MYCIETVLSWGAELTEACIYKNILLNSWKARHEGCHSTSILEVFQRDQKRTGAILV